MNEQCDKSSFSIFSDRQVWVFFQNEINAGDFTTFTRFFIRNQFISNLVLDTQKIKKLLELLRRVK